MVQSIPVYRGGVIEPLPGVRGASLRCRGFILERHEVPGGEFGDSEFRSHLVVLETNPIPFRLAWKENGLERTVDTGPGHVFIRSQQLMRDLRIGGTQQCVALSIDPEAMEMSLPEPFTGRSVELAPRGIGCDAVVNHLFAVLQAELESGGTMTSLMLESLGKATAVYVASHFSTNPPMLPRRRGLDRERLARVIDYIDANLADDLSLEETAGVACLSSYHFGRMFKISTGQTVHQFVLRQRIERSKTLLAQKQMCLAQIAVAAGFSSQSQFTTTFRRLVGLAPGAWQRTGSR